MFHGKKIRFFVKIFCLHSLLFTHFNYVSIEEWKYILVTYLDFSYLCGVSDFYFLITYGVCKKRKYRFYYDYHWQYTTYHIIISLS